MPRPKQYNKKPDSRPEEPDDELLRRPPGNRGFSFSSLPFETFLSTANTLDWPSWRRKFERYRLTSRLVYEPNDVQVSVLLLSMGDDAEEVFETFDLDSPAYDLVIQKFSNFYDKKVNIIYERAKFNKRSQMERESAEDFVLNLYKLIKTCGYGTLRDELLRDRLVIGVRDRQLSENLQMDSYLTLDSAIAKIKMHESVKGHQNTIRGDSNSDNLETLEMANAARNHLVRPKNSRPFKCYYCGETSFHKRDQCKARNSKCTFCSIVGHFESCCRKKIRSSKVGEVLKNQDDSSAEDTYIDSVEFQTLSINENIIPAIMVDLLVGGNPITFKVDTGADVTCIPFTCWRRMDNRPPLTPYNGVIENAGRTPLTCMGKFSHTLRSPKETCKETIFVIKELRQPLLGRTAIKMLSLLSFNDHISLHSLTSLDELGDQYHGLFSLHPGLLVGKPYHIKLKQDAVPYAIAAPRRIPLPIFDKVKAEIKRMEEMDIIEKVDEATQWCSPIVVVPKRDGTVRLCVDFTRLNEFVIRERFILPTTEETLAVIGKAKFFSKLDARMGFWQIPLDDESKNYTCFITPFSRYRFKRLPFGICSAPEHFQRRLRQILTGVEGCANLMDDILVFGNSQEEHDRRLHNVLRRLSEHNVTLNRDKCEISKTSVRFLGHEVSEKGILPDRNKLKAILDLPRPKNVTELKRFMGMFNYLSKFILNAAELSHPLNELLKSKVEFVWGTPQADAFQKIKHALVSPPVLMPFDPNVETRLSADASSFAIGAVLEQKSAGSNTFKPVHFVSRALIPAEVSYAQIEKEALAVSWACERLSMYLKGLQFSILTDHKPLVSLLGTKPIHDLTPRIQRFRLRLLGFNYNISHVSGKSFFIPDTLSRVGTLEYEIDDVSKLNIVESSVRFIHNNLAISDVLHKEIVSQTAEDLALQSVIRFIANNWQKSQGENPKLSPYFRYRSSLIYINDLIMMGTRIVIPRKLQPLMLDKLHSGHFGVNKCRRLAQVTVWWPGISKDIERKVAECYICTINRTAKKEPLLPTPLPELPWSRIGCDLMQLNGSSYLVIQDYFSKFLFVERLNSTTASAVIAVFQRLFGEHGVPQVVRADNGPQFCCSEFQEFGKSWGFQIITSSPHYPQSNGQAESAVHTAKNLLRKCDNLRIGVLSYNSTPLHNGYAPSELLMGRRLRTMVPISQENLRPQLPDINKIRSFEEKDQTKRKDYFDKRHGVKEAPELNVGDQVYIRDMKLRGIVTQKHENPRSYLINTSEGRVVRRNKFHLVRIS